MDKDFGLENSLLMSSNMHRFAQAKAKEKLGLPAMTLRNLEIFQTTADDSSICSNKDGSLFYHLNCTLTRFGCRQLKEWVSAPLTDIKEIEGRLDVVQHFVENHEEYQNFRGLLRSLPDLELLIMATINQKIRTSDFARMCSVMDMIKSKYAKLLKSKNIQRPKLFNKLADSIYGTFDSASKILKYIDMDAAKHEQKEAVLKKWNEYPKVGEHLKEIELLELGLDKHKQTICKCLGWTNFEYSMVSGQDYLIEVKLKDKHSVPDSWTSMSSTKQGNYQTLHYLKLQTVYLSKV